MGRQLSAYLLDEDQKKHLEFLQSKGVSRVHYSYIGNDIFSNIFTCCSMVDENNKLISRGVSICSALDQHNKKVARTKSFGRALKAITKEDNSLQIDPDGRRNFIVSRKQKFNNAVEAEEFVKTNQAEIAEPKLGNTDNKGRITLHYKILLNDPVDITSNYFQFKSEFRPEPTHFEKDIHKVEA